MQMTLISFFYDISPHGPHNIQRQEPLEVFHGFPPDFFRNFLNFGVNDEHPVLLLMLYNNIPYYQESNRHKFSTHLS